MVYSNRKKQLYLIKTRASNKYKIGVAKDSKKRLKQLQTGNSETLELVLSQEVDKAFQLEKKLHRIFCRQRLRDEWFALDGGDILKVREELYFIVG